MKFYENAPKTFREQEWIIEKFQELGGADAFWEMTEEVLHVVGVDSYTDIVRVKASNKIAGEPMFNHVFTRAFKQLAQLAHKREEMAIKAEKEGHLVTARDNYFAAAIFYTQAQVPFDDDDVDICIKLGKKKNECYDKFIKYAGHPVERVDIPFEDTSLPAYLHLPPNRSGKVPCVLYLGGTHMTKEMLVDLANDKNLERGMAVLAMDGPGQGEAIITRKIRFTPEKFGRAGRAAMDFLVKRPEIDADKIGTMGVSWGSSLVVYVTAEDPRYKAAVGLWYSAPFPKAEERKRWFMGMPNFGMMWRAGFTNEEEFSKAKETWPGSEIYAKVKCPFCQVGGEYDQFCSLERMTELMKKVSAPKKLVVYEDQDHGVSYGADARAIAADFMKDAVEGKIKKADETVWYDSEGKERKPLTIPY